MYNGGDPRLPVVLYSTHGRNPFPFLIYVITSPHVLSLHFLRFGSSMYDPLLLMQNER